MRVPRVSRLPVLMLIGADRNILLKIAAGHLASIHVAPRDVIHCKYDFRCKHDWPVELGPDTPASDRRQARPSRFGNSSDR